MANVDVADLRALEEEITKTNIAAVVGEKDGTDAFDDPEMAAVINIAAVEISIIKERNRLSSQCAFLGQQLATLQDKCKQLESTLSDAIAQRDYFHTAFRSLKESVEAAHRALTRGQMQTNQTYNERYEQQRAVRALSPKDDGKPIPQFLTDNVTPIKYGKPVRP